MTIDATLHAMVRDPCWLAHRYDPQHDAFHFIYVPREARRQAIFLIDDYLANASKPPLVIARKTAMEALADTTPAPLHMIFHSAFCCSTLMAQALEQDGIATVLSEPVVLNDIVGWRRRGALPDQLSFVLRDTLRLISRPFRPGEAVIVKPSNIVTSIALQIMAASPATRALTMYASLPTFLTSVAKKGLDGRLWVRGLFAGFLMDGIADLGFDADALFGQTDLQIAALGWLVQQRLFRQLLKGSAAKRVRTLPSDIFLADPAGILAAVTQLIALPLDMARIGDIVDGPIFKKHSKTGGQFGRSDRQAEYDLANHQHGIEIKQVCTWALQVADANAIPLTLGSELTT